MRARNNNREIESEDESEIFVKFNLNHKRNREKNIETDSELLSSISQDSDNTIKDKLLNLLTLLSNFFKKLEKDGLNSNYKQELKHFIKDKSIGKPKLGINEELTIQKYYLILLSASKTLISQDLSELEKSTISLIVLCHDYFLKNVIILLSNNTLSNLLKLDLYASIIFNPNEMPDNFYSIITSDVSINTLNQQNLIYGLSKQDIIYYATSNAALDAYSQLIINQKLVYYLINKNEVKSTVDLLALRKQIRKILTSFLTKTQIKSTNLFKGIAAITTYGLSIIINSEILKWKNIPVVKAFTITSILHELCHCLIRLINRNDNCDYYNNTQENLSCTESGVFFDKLLFNGNNKYSTKDSKFLLDKFNWTLDQETFLYNYINTINDIKDAATIRKKTIKFYNTKKTKEDDVYKCSRAYFKSSFI